MFGIKFQGKRETYVLTILTNILFEYFWNVAEKSFNDIFSINLIIIEISFHQQAVRAISG